MLVARALLSGLILSVAVACPAGATMHAPRIEAADECGALPVADVYQRAALSTVTLQDTAGASFGTGVVWDRQGSIVTNRHVAASLNGAVAHYADGHVTDVTIAHIFQGLDLAVLIPTTPSPRAQPIRRAVRLPSVGSPVLALGNPFGVGLSLSRGIVSATNRTVNIGAGTILAGAVQTDAALNPGNSGGPLLDSGGCMIGMNTAIISAGSAGSGVGFAIPVATVEHAFASLENSADVDMAGAPASGIGVIAEDGSGMIQIVDVEPGSRADKAGIRRGDIILGVAGHEVRTVDHAIAILSISVGDIPLQVSRGDAMRNLTVEGRRG